MTTPYGTRRAGTSYAMAVAIALVRVAGHPVRTPLMRGYRCEVCGAPTPCLRHVYPPVSTAEQVARLRRGFGQLYDWR